MSLALFRRLTWPWRALAGSVTAKVMVVSLATLIFVILLYSHLILRLREQWTREQLLASQEELRRAIVETFRDSGGDALHQNVHAYLDDLHTHTPNYVVRVLDNDSKVIFATGKEDLGRKFGLAGEGPASTMVRSIGPLPRMAACQSCHGISNTPMGSIIVDYPQSVVSESLDSDRVHLVTYAGAMLLMVGGLMLLALWVVVHNPLSRLATSVKEVRDGQLDTRLDIGGQDQFHQLADGFNDMVDSIKTARRELEAMHARQMAQADRLATVGKLASGLAHEIKNPLHGIGGALSVVARKVPDPALQEVVKEIHGQVERVARILEDMLTYARPSRPSFTECSLAEVVDKTLVLIQAHLREQSLQVVREDESLPLIIGDSGKLQQVLLNLLLNAIQATPQETVIFVRLQRSGDSHVILQVEDSGPGISPDQASHLFEPFYTTKPTGNGLGLAIVRTLVDQHGGDIRVLQGTPRGACFEVRLPVAGPTASD